MGLVKIAALVVIGLLVLIMGFISGQLSVKKIKLEFIKDGKINGWVIALFVLLFNLFFFSLAFLGVESVRKAWDGPMGDREIYFSIIVIGIWFTSKRVQDIATLMSNVRERIATRKIENGCLDEGGYNGKAG
jgi:uncharacterized BrkB/YihY/UPF0761 family membrane protein